MVAEELKVVVKAEVDKALRDMEKFDKSLESTGKSSQSLAQRMAILTTGVNQALEVFNKISRVATELVNAYRVQEQAEARLAAVIRATGGAAGFSAGEMLKTASALQDVTTYGDQAIIGMQSILATFKSIQGDVFERTTELALDLSTAFGQDLKGSAMQLGKALEDPITGLTALRRVGVSFTESQREMIESMVEAGEVSKAQTLILDILEGQVGGVARAMAQTATGQIDQFTNAFGDLKEAIGGVIVDSISPLMSSLTELVKGLANTINETRRLRNAVKQYEEGVRELTVLEDKLLWIEKEIETVRSQPILRTEQRYAVTLRLKELEEKRLATILEIKEAERQIVIEKEKAEQLAKDLADEAERELKAALERQRIEQQYIDGRALILNIMRADMTAIERETQEIMAHMAELEALRWKDADREADRLRALEILQRRLDELGKAAKALNEELNKPIKPPTVTLGGEPDAKDRLYTQYAAGLDKNFNTGLLTIQVGMRGLAKEIENTNAELAKLDEGFDAFLGETVTSVDDVEQAFLTVGPSWAEAMAAVKEKIAGIKEELGLVREEYEHLQAITALLDNLRDSVRAALDQAVIKGAVDGFVAIGDALAKGQNALRSFGSAIRASMADVTRSISTYAIAAAVRVLAETGMAGWPIALGLLALAGIAGVASGYLSGGQSELDKRYQDEIDARQKLIDVLRQQLDLELDVLRDAWQRNLISTAEYESASRAAADSTAGKIAGLPKWMDKSGEETLRHWITGVQEVMPGLDDEKVDAITEVVRWWHDLWNPKKSSAARGANFVTDGPQWLRVGDNASGREHVMVNPAPGSGMGTVINFNGPVFGSPDDIAVEIHNMMDSAERRGLITA